MTCIELGSARLDDVVTRLRGRPGLFVLASDPAQAFRSGDASLVVPLDFLRIPLIALVGWWLYGEPLDVFVFAGAGLIIAGVLWNLRAETVRPRLRSDAA